MEKKGIVGQVYTIKLAHQNYVGDKRKHTERNCWCWKEFNFDSAKQTKD